MTDLFDHTVLIVDDEEPLGKALGRIMKNIGVASVYVESGHAALARIKSSDKPFSLILSDQRMPGMDGSVFLEKAKEISPDTIRFLITGYADMDAITDAVNKGSIHRYIAKPWDNRVLAETVKAGLEQYEMTMENHRLFALAKEQNAKLYSVNTELKKSAEAHKKAVRQQDRQIAELNARIERGFENKNYFHEMETRLKENQLLDPEKLDDFYGSVIAELFGQFQDLAARNGFDMPDTLVEE